MPNALLHVETDLWFVLGFCLLYCIVFEICKIVSLPHIDFDVY